MKLRRCREGAVAGRKVGCRGPRWSRDGMGDRVREACRRRSERRQPVAGSVSEVWFDPELGGRDWTNWRRTWPWLRRVLADSEAGSNLSQVDQYEMKSYHPITIHVTPNSRVSHPGCSVVEKTPYNTWHLFGFILIIINETGAVLKWTAVFF